ncbi:hypothetical protein [Xylophilus ampelinus]|uniref:Lipoprotein n=1 Tax=Xylophilus ampelinus TaxID=54067 RepID=A0A318SLS2_9BURK|nr:hypothetical protein [Xylophilus ampelinus]MCS4508879.1 hypothetical protein [Xylophilus ampelinus]PYE79448.1 hypothetical protein DFQ15_102181 [Xylophilus ampelinus]
MKRAHLSLTAGVLLAGCASTPPAEPPADITAQACQAASADVRTLVEIHELQRACPLLPTLRAGASALERRAHTETIVRMYENCARSGS